jgi:hypothetical protein
LAGLTIEDVGIFYSHFVCFTPFGVFHRHSVYFAVIWYHFFSFWYVTTGKIWQPWAEFRRRPGIEAILQPKHFFRMKHFCQFQSRKISLLLIRSCLEQGCLPYNAAKRHFLRKKSSLLQILSKSKNTFRYFFQIGSRYFLRTCSQSKKICF